MGRKRNILIREYFTIIDGIDGNCKICKKKLNVSCLTNMKRHLQKDHPQFNNTEEEKIAKYEKNDDDKNIKFAVELSVTAVVQACVGLVTKQSVPFSLFDCDEFSILTGQIFDGLQMKKINLRNIADIFKEKSDQITLKIKNLTKNKIIYLKIDTATRHDRAILGINVQLIICKKIEIFTLAMLELKQKHTAQNLMYEIDSVLKNFDISKKQIYAITTDNGRNMIKAVELLSENYDDEETETESQQSYEEILNSLRYDNIISIKCAAHTLQLAVKNFLEISGSNIMNKARQIVKTLRTPTYRHSLKITKNPKPILDVPTRWSSTFSMLNRLLKLKNFCRDNLPSSEQLQEQEWIEFEEILKVLQPANLLTIKLQISNLLLGDFYKYWLDLLFTLKSIDTEMSRQFLVHVEKRQIKLLECDTLYAALYLDPRFKRVLTKEKIKLAKNHLKKLVLQIQNVVS